MGEPQDATGTWSVVCAKDDNVSNDWAVDLTIMARRAKYLLASDDAFDGVTVGDATTAAPLAAAVPEDATGDVTDAVDATAADEGLENTVADATAEANLACSCGTNLWANRDSSAAAVAKWWSNSLSVCSGIVTVAPEVTIPCCFLRDRAIRPNMLVPRARSCGSSRTFEA